MRLANGIVIDKEATFGALKFSALRREVHLQNEDGSVSKEIKERTYDLKSRGQGRMIQVSIPASVPLKVCRLLSARTEHCRNHCHNRQIFTFHTVYLHY